VSAPLCISRGDSLVAAAYLLEAYQSRAANRARLVAMSGAKNYEVTQRDLARLVLLLHPELRANIAEEHLP
jgi:hypothetical protein